MESGDQIDTQDLAQALSEETPSVLDLARALADIQHEVRGLREENLGLRKELEKYKPRVSPWGEPVFKESRPFLQPPKFGETFLKTPLVTNPGGTQPINLSVTTPTPVPLAAPERFYGDSSKYDIFLNQCQLQF